MTSTTLQGNPSPPEERWRLWPALALIIVPFLALIALQGHQVLSRSPRTALGQQLVAHSFEVILTAQSLRSALQDAERGQRGYLLTGEPAYLAPYDTALHHVPSLLARLTELTASQPDQQRRLTALAPAVHAKLEELRQTIAAYRLGGLAAAQQIVKTNAGLDDMQSIEAGIDAMIAAEARLRSARLEGLIAQQRTLERITMASALLVLILMLAGLALALLSFRKGRRLQREIQARAEDAAEANRQLAESNVELARAGELAAEAREEARRAERAKGRFLATASHDLRQPLQAVSLLNGTLRRLARDPVMTEALEQQDEAIGSMAQLLKTLLDISKLEAGVIEPQPQIVAVAPLLATLEREFRGIAASKGLELRVSACEAYVHSDPALLEQILRNLMSNAIKYTRSGSVRLRAAVDPPWVAFEVMDTGVGIAADQLQLIGEEFYQIGVPTHSTREGYGLGLSIVRRLVKLLGLELEVRSEVGKGSLFSVRVPQSAPPPADEQPRMAPAGHHAAPVAGATILLVEDDPDVCNATRMLLRTEGYEVMAAASLAEAVQRLRDSRGTKLLVTDFHLAAGETGVQVISRLRAESTATLKAILITGDTSSAVKDLAPDPNLRILSKPVQAEVFLELVRTLLA